MLCAAPGLPLPMHAGATVLSQQSEFRLPYDMWELFEEMQQDTRLRCSSASATSQYTRIRRCTCKPSRLGHFSAD